VPDGGQQLIGPVQYGWLWLALGIALLVLVAVWIGVVLLATRRRAVVAAAPLPIPLDSYSRLVALKEEYHAKVSEVEHGYAEGRLTARQAHSRLSSIVRAFARACSGIDAPTMTLTDLRQSPLGSVTQAIEEYYPIAFAPAEHDRIAEGIARARQVIQSWN
jgi:hypothetical protein